MKVENLKLPHLRNDEWFEFHTDFKATVKKHGENPLYIKNLWSLYLTQLVKADKNLLAIRKSVYTEEMRAADKERETILGSFDRVSKDSLNLPGTAQKEAASRIYNIVHPYKLQGLKSGYAAESSAIYNLLQDLSAYAADISLLALDEWMKSLREAEEKFLAIRAQRILEMANKPQEAQTDLLYHSMTNILDARLVADGLGGDVAVDPEDLDAWVWESNNPTLPYLCGNIVYNFVI